MVVLPAITTVISLACFAVVLRDGRRRPRPDKVAWAIAFALFAIAAGSEVVGALVGWSPLLARIYYVAGAVLVVGFLALGQLYLVAPRRTALVGPGVALLATALAITLVADAPVATERLSTEGWQALARGPELVALTVSLNVGGLLIVLAGTLSTAWRFRRRGDHRHRLFGCLLIASGTIVVALGGTLTRLGRPESLYIAMTVGAALILAGYLEARRPSVTRTDATPRESALLAIDPEMMAIKPSPSFPTPPPAEASPDPAIAFLEGHLLPLPDADLATTGREWSVEREAIDRLDRGQARRAWRLRQRLSPLSQAAFDAHTVAARLQLIDLYDEVLVEIAPGEPTTPEPRTARLTDLGERQLPGRGGESPKFG